eukprot:6291043-Pyramimonas_sp.AAC.1
MYPTRGPQAATIAHSSGKRKRLAYSCALSHQRPRRLQEGPQAAEEAQQGPKRAPRHPGTIPHHAWKERKNCESLQIMRAIARNKGPKWKRVNLRASASKPWRWDE